MKNKGFTLIELLAVIVILAIIALIAVPIILNIIDSTKKSANERSKELYLDAVEQAIARKNLTEKNGYNPTKCDVIQDSEDLSCEEDGKKLDNLTVEINGARPTKGTITFENGKVTSEDLVFGLDKNDKEDEVIEITNGCIVVSGDGTNVGDEIECVGEHFYVISNDGMSLKMLAKYNLNISDGTENSHLYPGATEGIQNENAKGYVDGEDTYYGTVAFSNSNYWIGSYDEEFGKRLLLSKYGSSYPAYVYDENSIIYQYIENYETYLLEEGINVSEARLISHDEISSLVETYSWIYDTTYWIGSSNEYDGNQPYILSVYTYGVYDTMDMYDGCGENGKLGVRPLVTISL